MDSIFGTEETPGKGRHDTEEYKNLKVMCPTQGTTHTHTHPHTHTPCAHTQVMYYYTPTQCVHTYGAYYAQFQTQKPVTK